VRAERLAGALAAARRRTRAQLAPGDGSGAPRTQICARLGGGLELVEMEDVVYFLAEQKYVTVRHRRGEVLIEESLKGLEREFADRFVRIHRNALVALARVGGLRRQPDGHHRLWFHDIDDRLAISRRHLPTVRQRLRTGHSLAG
ncbi:MAG: LytTR family DNA-binding domain-containing protein, partial [Halofilum sp. (in: g-proteobacteria)]